MKLTVPCDLFISSLDAMMFPNKNYKSGKLIVKLQGSLIYGSKLFFIHLGHKGRFQVDLVYSSEVDMGTAVKWAHQLGTADPIIAALTLREIILSAFE